MRRVENRGARSFAVAEWGEVNVVAGTLSHFSKQDAIHPVDDRTIEFSRAVKSEPVVLQAGDENVLDLKEAARMEERKRVAKAFERTGTHVKTKIAGGVFKNFFEVRGIQAGRELDIGQILDGDKRSSRRTAFQISCQNETPRARSPRNSGPHQASAESSR